MQLIVHHISKQKDSSKTQLTAAGTVVTWGQGVNQKAFFEQLKKLFDSKGKMYGVFDANSRFELEYLKHSRNNNQPLDLVNFSIDSVNRLEQIMGKTQFSTGGYIWYLFYKDNDNHDHLMVLVLNNADGFALELKNNTYMIGKNEHLDLQHLRMGVDINLSSYSANEDSYIQFKSGSKKETSIYFYDKYVETKNIYSSSKASTMLMDWMQSQFDGIASATNKQGFQVQALLDDFLKDREEVCLEELAELFYPGDKAKQDTFIDTASKSSISEKIELDSTVIKRYRQIQVRKKGSSLDLKFSATDVDNRVVEVDKKNKRIIIPDIAQEVLDKF